jgi:hypothetical protein
MDVVSLESYLREIRMDNPSEQEGAALLSPQRKCYVTHNQNTQMTEM